MKFIFTVQLLTEDFAQMSPCELEAQGLILSEQNVTTQGDITDVHQRLAGIFIALAVFFFY